MDAGKTEPILHHTFLHSHSNLDDSYGLHGDSHVDSGRTMGSCWNWNCDFPVCARSSHIGLSNMED